MRFTLDEIARATGGEVINGSPDWIVEGVTLDSRMVKKDHLFFAIKGETRDGHDFIGNLQGIKVAAVSERIVSAEIPLVVVKDSRRALQELARHAVSRMSGLIVAVSGSVGKTTTRELTRLVLSSSGATVAATAGNLNSTLGLPLTLCNFPEVFTFAVLEMGMNRPGELDLLGSIAPMDLLLYTNVRAVHTEFFDGVEGVALAKAELLKHLKSDGILIHPHVDDHLNPHLESWRGKDLTFGMGGGTVSGEITENLGYLGGELSVRTPSAHFSVTLPEGHLPPENLLAAISVAYALNLDMEAIIPELEKFKPLPGRGRVVRTAGGTIVDDCYNASPAAVQSSLLTFSMTGVEGRKIFVFGDMLELGLEREVEHIKVGEAASEVVDVLVTVGPLSSLASKIPNRRGIKIHNMPDAVNAADLLDSILREDDWVLVKGSRGVGLDVVVRRVTGETRT